MIQDPIVIYRIHTDVQTPKEIDPQLKWRAAGGRQLYLSSVDLIYKTKTSLEDWKKSRLKHVHYIYVYTLNKIGCIHSQFKNEQHSFQFNLKGIYIPNSKREIEHSFQL